MASFSCVLLLSWAVGGLSLSLDGCWTDRVSGSTVRIVDRGMNGGGLFLTSDRELWSPAAGYLDADGRSVAFSLGLKNVVALYNATRDVLRFTNGVVWERKATRECTLPARWSEPPHIGGCWKTTRGDEWTVAVLQTGKSVLMHSAWWSEWSPAVGEVDLAGRVSFRYGLAFLTATVGFEGTTLSFTNGESWYRTSDTIGNGCGQLPSTNLRPATAATVRGDVQLAGCWEDPVTRGTGTITSLGGGLIYATMSNTIWSPAVGRVVDGLNVVFSLGLPQVEAQYDVREDTIRFVNAAVWKRQVCSNTSVPAPRPQPVPTNDAGVPSLEGCWLDDSRNSAAVVQEGATVAARSEGQSWSPAVGEVDQNGHVTFRYGLAFLTMDLSRDGKRLTASNGVTWHKIADTLSYQCGKVPSKP